VFTYFAETPRASLRVAGRALAIPGAAAPSPATVARYIETALPCAGFPALSLKLVSRRAPAAQTLEIKQRRVDVIRELTGAAAAGYFAVYVDETHWEVGLLRRRARAPVGRPSLAPPPPRTTTVSAIASLTELGPRHALIVEGPINRELFCAYLRNLLGDLLQNDRITRVLIFLDNAPIHRGHEVDAIVEGTPHRLLYNAPYSPELNPIEMMFSIWKRRAEETVTTWTDREDLLRQLRQVMMTVPQDEATRIVYHVKQSTWPKALALEDL